MSEPWQKVLNFWFGHPEEPEYGQMRKDWFRKSKAFDLEVEQQLGDLYQRAIAHEFDSWQDQPQSCLALILLFDQAPRNLFRGQPPAFATDDQALSLAKGAIAKGFDEVLLPLQRLFIYLPFEHSETIDDQHQSMALFQRLNQHTVGNDFLEYAQRHFDVIEQFGRFPHRNQVLGRPSTTAELEFLAKPGSSF